MTERFKRFFAVAYLYLAACAVAAETAAPETPAPAAGGAAATANEADSWADKIVVLQITDPEGISWDGWSLAKDKVAKLFARVKNERPKALVVEIDSPGGRIDTCNDLSKMLKECGVPTKALVTHMAVSGGAIIATACRDIYMVKGSRIGDVKPIMLLNLPIATPQDIPGELREKIERDVIALLESNAEANHRDPAPLKAMVSASIEMYALKLSDGTTRFLTKKETEVFEENVAAGRERLKIVGKELVCEEDKLLELTAQKALEYGIITEVVESRDAFFSSLGGTAENTIIASVSGEKEAKGGKSGSGLSSFQLVLLGIFLILGIAGALTEAHTPGFGIPGAVSLICFACFFYILVRAGNAEWYEILIFTVGIALLVVEIVLLPGFGVPGILGIVLIVGGLFMAFTPSFGSTYMHEHLWDATSSFIILLGGSLLGAALVAYGAIMLGRRLPFLSKFFLTGSLNAGPQLRAEMRRDFGAKDEELRQKRAALVGKEGTALTLLRPAGKVRLDDGEMVDVVVEGGLLQSGARVRVSEASLARIVVVAAAPAAGGKA